VKKARHKLKIPSGRTTRKKEKQNTTHFLSHIKIETEITGNLVNQSVSMLTLMKTTPTENLPADQKPGIEFPPVKIPDTKTSENKTTESERPVREISPGGTVQNDAVKYPGSNVVGESNSESKAPEGNISEGNNAGGKRPGSEGPNAGGTNEKLKESDQCVEIQIDVESVPSTSGLQDCGMTGNVAVSLTQEAGSSKIECGAPSVVSKDEKTKTVTGNLTATNPVYFERKGTLFTEGIGLTVLSSYPKVNLKVSLNYTLIP
jgi:hypothetical protein